MARMLNHWIAILFALLAFWILLNGIDDLFVAIAGVFSYIQRKYSTDPRERTPSEEELDAVPPRRMAVFVALWKEHKVIQKMIDNNVTKLRYSPLDFFVGVYPNDAPTRAAVTAAMTRYPNIHLSTCAHDGPSSKAANLN